jgi:hypothetical protein
MKITNYKSLKNITDLPSIIQYTAIDLDLMISVTNGNVDLVDNCNTQLLPVTFYRANTTYAFTHNLGRIPQGYVNAGINANATIFNGSGNNNIQNIYLQASNICSGKVLVF